jgi:hypothetical protein
MKIDNASPQIIQQTRPEHLEYVRLYFRPRTPTQYRNEGIRPVNQRELGGAHCPMPVYFCFDALTVLALDRTEFSDGNMGSARASHSAERDFFLSIPFHLVFHNRWFTPDERDEIVFRRNAEVLVPGSLPLDPALKRLTNVTRLSSDATPKCWCRVACRWIPRSSSSPVVQRPNGKPCSTCFPPTCVANGRHASD